MKTARIRKQADGQWVVESYQSVRAGCRDNSWCEPFGRWNGISRGFDRSAVIAIAESLGFNVDR